MGQSVSSNRAPKLNSVVALVNFNLIISGARLSPYSGEIYTKVHGFRLEFKKGKASNEKRLFKKWQPGLPTKALVIVWHVYNLLKSLARPARLERAAYGFEGSLTY
jgi:hypothetical protein